MTVPVLRWQVVSAEMGMIHIKGKKPKVADRLECVVEIIEPAEMVGKPIQFLNKTALMPKFVDLYTDGDGKVLSKVRQSVPSKPNNPADYHFLDAGEHFQLGHVGYCPVHFCSLELHGGAKCCRHKQLERSRLCAKAMRQQADEERGERARILRQLGPNY